MLNFVVVSLSIPLLWSLGASAQDPAKEQYSVQLFGVPPCDALLAAGLGERVLFPDNASYAVSVTQYYALNTRKRPWCIFQPHSAQEISLATMALQELTPDIDVGGIAIRSGGHSAAEFASGIVNGVTFDLGMMNRTVYNPATSLASIEPGARWGHVYKALSPYNVTVSGGRDADVGVGGLLLGGGISYYASRVGMSCDTVVNYEVVLANGSIVNANATHAPDLWRALKGGTNNFGVVTRFDKRTNAGQDVWFSQRTISSSHSAEYTDAVVKFTRDNNDHPEAAIVGFFIHASSSKGISIILQEINTVGSPNTTIFEPFDRIPANVSTPEVQSLAMAATTFPGGTRSVGSTLTLKNDATVLRSAVQLYEEYVEHLSSKIGSENFTSTCFFEPIPASVQKHGDEAGGNMLGLPVGEDVIIWDVGAETASGDESLDLLRVATNRLTAQVQEAAEREGGHVNLVYANYADATQNVIGSYPAKNLEFMRSVANAYDPKGFFQRQVSGGFKLPRTD